MQGLAQNRFLQLASLPSSHLVLVLLLPAFYTITASGSLAITTSPGALCRHYGDGKLFSGSVLSHAAAEGLVQTLVRCHVFSFFQTLSLALPWAGFNHLVAPALRSFVMAWWGLCYIWEAAPRLSLDAYTGFGLGYL